MVSMMNWAILLEVGVAPKSESVVRTRTGGLDASDAPSRPDEPEN